MNGWQPFSLVGKLNSAVEANPADAETSQGHLDHPQLAIDGKTLRATSMQDHPVHLLSCYDVITGTVLWQCNVLDKQNEISALKPLLTPTLVKGRIFSLDAMHTQRYFCAHVHRLEGDYVLIAKDNQPTLRADIADLFEDRTPDRRRWQYAETWDKGHGRLEHRQITVSPDLNDWFHKEWEGIEQVFRLERTVRSQPLGSAQQHRVKSDGPPGCSQCGPTSSVLRCRRGASHPTAPLWSTYRVLAWESPARRLSIYSQQYRIMLSYRQHSLTV
jgi:predicted transposase YbfD/YdcC